MTVSPQSDIVVFLCPSGHKLNSPRKLQGEPGQCPHCGIKFRVPRVDPVVVDSPTNEAIELDSSTDVSPSSQDLISEGGISAILSADDQVLDDSSSLDAASGSSSIHMKNSPAANVLSGRASRLFQEFLILWSTKSADSVIELHLPDGEIFSPQLFSRSRSTSEYGYFARETQPDTFIVHIIPWVSVCRIVASGLTNLPADLKSKK
ncbi:MAG: hypothetical protein COA78_25865 [Blastopirellula sp.]|nr:MAG: hypothetical protein COA78_25865 [Blastopirellula sp.]